MEEDLVKRGKELSYLLRHDKEYKFPKHGWRDIKDLIDNHNFTQELIEEIVKTNDKQRYEFNPDHTKIRARQGHSINVDVELKEQTPPDILYHGTSWNVRKAILDKGLLKMNRLHVHLSSNLETARKVGKRHGARVTVFQVDSKKMSQDGIKFFKSNNGVWLVEQVKPKYLKEYE